MSAIEQPAARSGRITCWSGRGEDVGRLGHEVDAAEDDELGLGPGGGVAGELERVAGDVGELDDLVALVVVARARTPGRRAPPWPRGRGPPGRGRRRRAGRPGTRRRARSARSTPRPEGQQREVDGRHGSHPTAGVGVRAGHRGERTARAASSRAGRGSRSWCSSRRAASPTSSAHWFAAVTWATVDRAPGPSASAAQSSAAAVRRLVAASSASGPARCEVGVARPGGGVGDEQPARARACSSWSAPCAGAAGAAVERVHQVDVGGAALAHLLDDRERATGRRCRCRYICGCSVEPGPAVAAHGLAGPAEAESIPRRQPRPWCSAASSSGRPMPWPWRPGQHGVRREAPQQLAAERRRDADHAGLVLGDPAAARVGAAGGAGCARSSRAAARPARRSGAGRRRRRRCGCRARGTPRR